MVSLDDWSELITIDYNAGLGGDFFALILHEAIFNDTIYKSIKNNKFSFVHYDVFSKSKKESSGLKNLYYLRRKFYNSKYSGDNFSNDFLTNVFNDIFKEKLTFPKEFRNYVYSNYKHKFDGNIKISLFHDNDSRFLKKIDDETLPIIFPKSKNIILTCPDYYMFFSRFLLIVKILTHFFLKTNKNEFLNFIDKQYNNLNNFQFYLFNNYQALKIDVFSLFYEQKSYDKELSDLLGKEIILNKEKINEYAKKNIEIFNQYNLDIDNIYSEKYFKEKANLFLEKLISEYE